MDEYAPSGKTTIAPEVLLTIAKLATLGVDGVAGMSPVPGDVKGIFNRSGSEGVKVSVDKNTVSAELYVVIKCDTNVRDVARMIQSRVSRAISEMVGMDVGKINVHIEDIDYSERQNQYETTNQGS